MTSHADYNGHSVSVSYKPHAVSGPTWNAEYVWSGRVVLARGSFATCVAAALREYKRGALGTRVRFFLDSGAPESLNEQVEIVKGAGAREYEPVYPEPHPSWWTGAHTAALDAYSMERRGPHIPGMMDAALAFTGTPEEWQEERNRLMSDWRMFSERSWCHE